MEPTTFELEIATPERLVLREQVSEAQIPGKDGYLGILPGHAPLLSELASGVLEFSIAGRRACIAIIGGFVQVTGERTRVLSDTAEKSNEIDVERAQRALKRAEERVAAGPSGKIDLERAMRALVRAQTRIDCAKRK